MEPAERRLFEGMIFKFLNNWKRKTKLEEKAIQSLKAARRILLENLPKDKIVAIYVGGSFTRREMNEKSDVDTWTIVKDTRLLKRLEDLHQKYRYKFKPEIGIQGYSLKELKMGKSISQKPKLNPNKFLMKINNYSAIFGKPIGKDYIPLRHEKEELSRSISFLEKKLIPEFERTNSGFLTLVKQTFWLVDLEQRARGKNPPYSWKGLVRSIHKKRHIIHDAFYYREHPTKDKMKRGVYVQKLKRYIALLEEEF